MLPFSDKSLKMFSSCDKIKKTDINYLNFENWLEKCNVTGFISSIKCIATKFIPKNKILFKVSLF